MFYKGRVHMKIFVELVTRNPNQCSNGYLAALYLLCSDKDLWNSVKSTVGKNTIGFDHFELQNMTTHGYALCQIAQDICTGSTHITLNDLCNSYLVGNQLFELVLTALRIGREGYAYLGISMEFN